MRKQINHGYVISPYGYQVMYMCKYLSKFKFVLYIKRPKVFEHRNLFSYIQAASSIITSVHGC